MKEKIYAIIVTYNPDMENLKKSIERIEREVDGIIICNNSNKMIEVKNDKIEYINFETNLGIAKAQNVGMKRAFGIYKADFIIQFDQDSLMDVGMIKVLKKTYIEYYKKNKNISIIGPQEYDKDTLEEEKIKFYNKKNTSNTDIIQVEVLISSGCLISKEVYFKIGGMKEEWFIDIVDFEYCWRAKKNGVEILKLKNARLAHKLGEGKVRTRLGFKINIGSPIRHYYQFRNILYSLSLNYIPLKWKVGSVIKLLFKILFYKILLKDGKVRVEYMKKGIIAYFRGDKNRIDTNL